MPKYLQIAQIVEEKIRKQIYAQGQRLPSISTLAKEYHCSKDTIIKCYQVLINKHFIYVKSQSGYYVAGNIIKPSFAYNKLSLESGNPIVSATSLVDAKHCLSIAIDQYSQSSLNLSLQGVDSLRQTLSDFLADMGIYSAKDTIYLIQGVTQMLAFLTTIDFPNQHHYILIEEPTYSYYVQFLKSLSLPILTIRRDENGIDVKHLQYLFSHYDIKFFYVVTRNHNPLGTTLNTQTRQKIAKLALQYHVYIIEDDYFGHCSLSSHYLPIFYYMEGQNAIYLTSFSKTIPYIRIGCCVIHDDFKETFEKMIHQSYYYSYQLPSLISQATLESYITSSLYFKQTQQLQKQLKKDYQIIKNVTAKWDQQLLKVISGKTGYYLTIAFQVPLSLDILQEQLMKRHVTIARNERCFYIDKHFQNSIRLSLARIQPQDIKQALDIFYDTFLQCMHQHQPSHHLLSK